MSDVLVLVLGYWSDARARVGTRERQAQRSGEAEHLSRSSRAARSAAQHSGAGLRGIQSGGKKWDLARVALRVRVWV
eukprot:scaffold155445_cov31-Tisochrysis_lutea.AAC.1